MTAAAFYPLTATTAHDQPLPAHSSMPEMLSALADGALKQGDLAQLLGAKTRPFSAFGHESADDARDGRDSDSLLECWSTYHLIGEALRTPGQAAKPADSAFLARFRQAAQGITTQETPLKKQLPSPVLRVTSPVEAANDPVFRWKLVAGFASLTAVCAVAWQMAGLGLPGAQTPELGQSGLLAQRQPSSLLAAAPAGTVIQASRMEELLAAHRQHGGGSAVQMPGPYLRNAAFAFDAPGR